MKLFSRVAVSAMLGVSLGILAVPESFAQGAAPYEKWRALSEREKTFLKTVFNGDEAKAVEFAQVAGINVNSLAGEPLSVWFYRMAVLDSGPSAYRNVAVQRIVFERFKQNPNPSGVGENRLDTYCNQAPAPQDFALESRGTPEQIKGLRDIQANARRPHIEAMGAGFESLIRYGLRDKALITAMFKGCVFNNHAPVNAFMYDTVLSKMVKAGANINLQTVAGERPIAKAVQTANAELIERLIRDGAQVNYPVLLSGFDKLDPGEQCQPRRYRSLYKFVFEWTRVRDKDNVVAVVAALAKGGLSPITKYGYVENPNGTQICKYASFYDAVVDTGNLDFARAIKKAAVAPVVAQRPVSPPPPAAAPASPPASPATSAPRVEQANVTAPGAIPPQVGAWIIRTKNDGRLHATAKVSNSHPDRLAGLILECMPGGRLEYVPAILKLNGFAKSLHVHGKDDNMNELKLASGRLAGAGAATLSRDLLQAEINARRQGQGDKWDIGMTVDDANVEESMVQMSGFAQMRNLMLANCKN